MQPILNIAIRAARKAGNTIAKASERMDKLTITEKNPNDFVTEVDQYAEREIVSIIRESYPSHGIVGEEGAYHEGDEYQWIIDPLDGTNNFIHGFPHYAVSIAIKVKQRIEYAVIYDPIKQDLFHATRGHGAQLNDHRIRVSGQAHLHRSLLGTGFPFRDKQLLPLYLETFTHLFEASSGIRRAGSAALDLAYVAAGKLDGFWEFGLNQWDIAAGILLIKEAGGMICDLHGGENYWQSGNIVAGSPKILKAMVQKLTPLVKASANSLNQ